MMFANVNLKNQLKYSSYTLNVSESNRNIFHQVEYKTNKEPRDVGGMEQERSPMCGNRINKKELEF